MGDYVTRLRAARDAARRIDSAATLGGDRCARCRRYFDQPGGVTRDPDDPTRCGFCVDADAADARYAEDEGT